MFEEVEKFQLSIPFKCPLSCCSEDVSSSSLLVHLIQVHQIAVREVKTDEKTTLIVNPNYLQIGESVCVGILALNSQNIRSKNALLSFEHRHLEFHFPILIMAACDNYERLYGDENEFFNPEANFLTFWFASPTMETKLSASITLHDECLKKSLSSLITVRKAEISQKTEDFVPFETDHLTSNFGVIQSISSSMEIQVEVSIFKEIK